MSVTGDRVAAIIYIADRHDIHAAWQSSKRKIIRQLARMVTDQKPSSAFEPMESERRQVHRFDSVGAMERQEYQPDFSTCSAVRPLQSPCSKNRRNPLCLKPWII